METTKIEVAAVEQVVADAAREEMLELNALQLALIGGGIGEVIVA